MQKIGHQRWLGRALRCSRSIIRFLTHPAVRIVGALSIGLVLILGVYAEKDSAFVYGWLPGWYKDFYVGVAASLTVQPFLSSLFDVAKKNTARDELRRCLDESLGELSDPIREIARITYDGSWTRAESRRFERQAVRAIRQVFLSIEVPGARVCFYKVSATDETEFNESGLHPVNELLYVTHHGGQKPNRIFRREDDNAKGLFDALDSGQLSRESDRPGFDESAHHWRSVLRVPVFHEETQYGVLTLDSSLKSAIDDGHDKILSFGAALIGLARLCETEGRGPTGYEVTHAWGNFFGGNANNEPPDQ